MLVQIYGEQAATWLVRLEKVQAELTNQRALAVQSEVRIICESAVSKNIQLVMKPYDLYFHFT